MSNTYSQNPANYLKCSVNHVVQSIKSIAGFKRETPERPLTYKSSQNNMVLSFKKKGHQARQRKRPMTNAARKMLQQPREKCKCCINQGFKNERTDPRRERDNLNVHE